MKQCLLLFAFCLFLTFANAQCALQVIGFNGDNPNQILLYTAGTIPANTTYYLTDNEWNSISNTGFVDLAESEFSWTAPAGGLSAGNYILLEGTTATCGTSTGTLSLSANGDQIYITTVAPATTGMTEGDVCLALDYSAGGTGMSGSFTGTNIDLGVTDNANFTGTTFSEAAIEIAANWATSTNIIDLINSIAITGVTACINPPAIQFTTTVSAFNENGGTVNVCVTIKDGNTSATTVNVALTGSPGTASVGDYSVTPPLPATLTFPANSPNGTQECITINTINDLILEGNETINLILQNPVNGVLDVNQTHTATLLDDDYQIVITEIMYDPCSGGGSNFWTNEGDGEFVEIYNNGSTTIDISAWTISDNDAGSFGFTFPGTAGSGTTTIAPGEYLVIARQVVYLALDGNGDGMIDAGNIGAGSKIFNEDIAEGASTGGNLNNVGGDDVELKTDLGTTIDVVNYSELAPWPTCAGTNDGISLVLPNPNADNSIASNWYPSLTSGAGASGGGTPGAANAGGACISSVSTNVTQSGCGTANPVTTVNVTFTTAYSAVANYDIYQNGNFLGTYNAGTTAAGTYTYTTPNLAPTMAGSVNFEVRPTGAPANSCYVASSNINIPSCPLPIELLYFTGVAADNHIALEWKTLTEKQNAYMAIERSKDGVSFFEIGQVAGAGNTSEPQIYYFKDWQPTSGINYYRLKQVDQDGNFEYHQVIAIEFTRKSNDAGFQFYPTEVGSSLNIRFESPLTMESVLWIVDVTGRTVARMKISTGTQAQILELDMSSLPPGVYLLALQTVGSLQTARFIKL